jgi:HD-like signal output (HDOD) protein
MAFTHLLKTLQKNLSPNPKTESSSHGNQCLLPSGTHVTAMAASKDAGFSSTESKRRFYAYLFEQTSRQPLSVPERLVIEIVARNLKKKEERGQAVPRLPSVIPKLLQSLKDPDSSAKEYVGIINKDPAMSAAALKLANSVYFNPLGKHIEELDTAVVKLGIQGLRTILSAAVMQPIIQRNSPYFSQTGQKLWNHTLCCAVACEVVGKIRQLDRYKVYLMGLVHDIGEITLFSELCRQFVLNGTADNPSYNAFAQPMTKLSAQLSYWVAKDWELPSDICDALKEQAESLEPNVMSPFGRLLYEVNLATEHYAITPHKERAQLRPLLKHYQLPATLWDTLDRVHMPL